MKKSEQINNMQDILDDYLMNFRKKTSTGLRIRISQKIRDKLRSTCLVGWVKEMEGLNYE